MFHSKPKYAIEDLLAVYWKLTKPSPDGKKVEQETGKLSDVDGEAESATCNGSLSQPGK